MKWLVYCTVSLLALVSVSAQVNYEKLAVIDYKNLPFNIRIENSGIYCLSSFDVKKGDILLNAFDSPERYSLKSGSVSNSEEKLPAQSRKIFVSENSEFIPDESGLLRNERQENISVKVKSRSELEINCSLENLHTTVYLNFLSDLAYADLIGIDKKGNSFILTESYITEIPLKVKREILTVSSDGSLLSVLEIPPVKYLYTVSDFRIDAEGCLYHILTERDRLTVLKWNGLTERTAGKIKYPEEYNYELHFNSLTPTEEFTDENNPEGSEGNKRFETAAVSRSSALRIGDTYVLHQYSCRAANLSPVNVTGPDGDIVRTPSWLISGMNARVPYMWGGFNTINSFDNGLLSGKYAGDINTAGVSGYAVGVDCSGFVSRCWQLTYHCSTSGMPNITGAYGSWDEMKPGDAVLKNGHVRMFIEKTSNGALRIVEASARDWGVSYWTYAPSDLTEYTPRFYTGMTNDYSFSQPELLSVIQQEDGTAKLTFSCDTAGVKGYRLYSSSDGQSWKMIKDENTLKSLTAVAVPAGSTEFYRVSSVMNNYPSFTESSWSNVLGIRKSAAGIKKILIVDGFERNTGGWRGNGTAFVLRYGAAAAAQNLAFESVKNSQLLNSSVKSSSYDAVFWMLGDESTVNETFSTAEQALVTDYLAGGGKLFVSGSEVGWDLSAKGSTADKDFYTNYFKATYIADNSASSSVTGTPGSVFGGIKFNFAQTFEVGYPDEIGVNGGSTLCMQYSNGKGAGVQYNGKFGTSGNTARLIYLGFPLETTANDSAFNAIIGRAADFFFGQTGTEEPEAGRIKTFDLEQNYPNPFNPLTVISYSLPSQSRVTIKIYNLLGEVIAAPVNELKSAGRHELKVNAGNLSSGIYFYSIEAVPSDGSERYSQTRKMTLLK